MDALFDVAEGLIEILTEGDRGVEVIVVIILIAISLIGKASKQERKRPGRVDNAVRTGEQGTAERASVPRPSASPKVSSISGALNALGLEQLCEEGTAQSGSLPQTPQSSAATGQPMSQMSISEREARRKALEARRAARRQAAKAAQPRVAASEEEDSAMLFGGVDEEGCVGGSMAHEHTEGESREEHGAHIAAMERRDVEEAAQGGAGRFGVLGDMSLEELRRAVIVSEVLGKPKALRR